MRLIDADALKERLIKERDAIPLTKTERYGFGVEFPDPHGTSMRGGINKAFRCMEETPTIDAVVLPCKIGDFVWAIRNYNGVKHPQQGKVADMYFTTDMRLHIVVSHIARGEWGKVVFPTREEADAALAERGSNENRT